MRGLVVAILGLVTACAAAATPTPAAVTSAGAGPSPAHALLEAAADLDGRPVGALPARGRATVAVVFASWCTHCRAELPVLAALAHDRPDVRILGLNYRGHEEYDGRGDAAAVRAFVAALAPWLRVVPTDDALWSALGRPPKVPTIYVFDRGGRLVRTFDRRQDEVPTLAALEEAVPP